LWDSTRVALGVSVNAVHLWDVDCFGSGASQTGCSWRWNAPHHALDLHWPVLDTARFWSLFVTSLALDPRKILTILPWPYWQLVSEIAWNRTFKGATTNMRANSMSTLGQLALLGVVELSRQVLRQCVTTRTVSTIHLDCCPFMQHFTCREGDLSEQVRHK
jgi:hypothetical protein